MRLNTPTIHTFQIKWDSPNSEKGRAAEDYTNCVEKPKLERLWRPAPTRESRSKIDITKAIPISRKQGREQGEKGTEERPQSRKEHQGNHLVKIALGLPMSEGVGGIQ
jgi:hypothetical protein